MATQGKVVITCAITGAVHTPMMTPYLPITPDQIAAEAIAAAEAGAAVLHLHARDPETGKPDQTPAAFSRFLPRIKHRRPRRRSTSSPAAGPSGRRRSASCRHRCFSRRWPR